MNRAEAGSRPPQPNQEKRFYTGVQKNPDGTLDYSKAAFLHDPTGEHARNYEKMKREEREARARRFEIPERVKPGSPDMVWYRLRNTIEINREAVQRARQEGKTDPRRKSLIESQERQQEMLSETSRQFGVDWLKEEFKTGRRHTAEQAQEKSRDLTAAEMHELVQKYEIDNPKHEEWMGDDGSQYRVQDARDLQSLLIDEANRGQEWKNAKQ